MSKSYASGQEEFSLTGYNDGKFEFTGRLFSEGSFFDAENGMLTRLRLFAMQDGRLVYHVVSSGSGPDERKDRRVYVLHVEDDICHIDNGKQSVSMPMDMLFDAVYSFCGMESSQKEELKATLRESLRAVGV
jgi:hypothetical protein